MTRDVTQGQGRIFMDLRGQNRQISQSAVKAHWLAPATSN